MEDWGRLTVIAEGAFLVVSALLVAALVTDAEASVLAAAFVALNTLLVTLNTVYTRRADKRSKKTEQRQEDEDQANG